MLAWWYLQRLLLVLPCVLLLLEQWAAPPAPALRRPPCASGGCPAPPDPRTPPAVRAWHALTPPAAAAWQERLEREEGALREAFGGLAGVAPPRAGTFEASRPYLVWMLEAWVARHGVASAGAAMGTHAPDPEWAVLPHDADSALFCVYGGAGPVLGPALRNASLAFAGRYGLSDPCDLHAMALPGALGTRDLFVWGQTLEHLMDPELAMARIASHLAPGGWHVLSAPAHNIPHAEPFHFFMYTPAGLAALAAAAGTPAVEVGYYGDPAFNAATHTMSFFKGGRVAVPGNQLTERYWPGELPGAVPLELRGAAQVMMLARRQRGRGGGADAADALARARPPLLPAERVWALWEAWVRGQWGWAPAPASLRATQRALAASPACAGLARSLGAGEYLAMVGLYEGLAGRGAAGSSSSSGSSGSSGSGGTLPPAAGPWAVAAGDEALGACHCLVAAAAAAASAAAAPGAAPGAETPPPPPACAPWTPATRGAALVLVVDTLEYTADAVAHVAEAVASAAPGGLVWAGARAVAPRDPYARGRLMLRSVTPSALVVTLERAGACVAHAGHWGTRGALTRWVSAEAREGASLEGGWAGGGEAAAGVEAGEWVSAIHGWALGRRARSSEPCAPPQQP